MRVDVGKTDTLHITEYFNIGFYSHQMWNVRMSHDRHIICSELKGSQESQNSLDSFAHI